MEHEVMIASTDENSTVFEKAEENFYDLVITSDHGNADYMKDSDGNVIYSNSDSKVPLIICNENIKLKETGKLCDVIPTIIDMVFAQL